MAREAGDVHLVDDGLTQSSDAAARRPPSRKRRGSTTTLFMAIASLSPVLAGALAGVCLGHDDGAPVGIEQHLARIETQTCAGSNGPKARYA